MRIFVLTLLALMLFLLPHCGNSNVLINVEGDLGQSMRITLDHVIEIESEGLSLGLTGEILESRCPNGVTCVWAGEVLVEFWFQIDENDTIFANAILSGSGTSVKRAIVPCYRVELQAVDPYPEFPENDFPKVQSVTLVIEKVACNKPPNNVRKVQVSTQSPAHLQKSNFQLNDVSISGDILFVDISYSGGCNRHAFELFVNPYFAESYPGQVNLYLYHDDIDDACDAWITSQLQFDLTPVAELFHQYYGEYDDIILNIFEFFETTPGGYQTVTYSP